jgi:hypothetical protein
MMRYVVTPVYTLRLSNKQQQTLPGIQMSTQRAQTQVQLSTYDLRRHKDQEM